MVMNKVLLFRGSVLDLDSESHFPCSEVFLCRFLLKVIALDHLASRPSKVGKRRLISRPDTIKSLAEGVKVNGLMAG